MKNWFLLWVLTVVPGYNALLAQPLTTTTHDFNTFEINNYIVFYQQNLSYKICEWVKEKKVKGYTDNRLTKAVSDSFGLAENRQIPNPNNPDDIYDLIDTIIYHPANFYNGRFQFISDKVFCLVLTVKDSVFINSIP